MPPTPPTPARPSRPAPWTQAKLAPLDPLPWTCLGHLYYEASDLESACHCLTSALRCRPGEAASTLAALSMLVRQLERQALQERMAVQERQALQERQLPQQPGTSGQPSGGGARGSGGGVGGPWCAPAGGGADGLSLALAQAAVEAAPFDGYTHYALALARLSAFFQPVRSPRSSAGRARELQDLLAAFAKVGPDLYFARLTAVPTAVLPMA